MLGAKTRGRPRKSIDTELLNAAAEEFLAHGFEAANIDAIAAAAASTKPALYRRYSSKQALFEAALLHLAKDFEIDLAYLSSDARPPDVVLLELAQFFHRHISSSKVTAMSRLLITEGARFPELTIGLRKTVMQSYLPHTIAYFERLNKAGLTAIGDTTEAAIIFTTLTGKPFETLMGVKIKRGQVLAHLRELVRFFLAGYGYRFAEAAPARRKKG